MANPKGFRNRSLPLKQGGQVMVYSSQDEIYLQLRREIPTETDILQPSFKVAVSLTPAEALTLAAELLQISAAEIQRS